MRPDGFLHKFLRLARLLVTPYPHIDGSLMTCQGQLLLGQPATHYLTHSICSRGAGEGPRSLNPIWATDFKSVLYSNSSTPAYQWAVFRDAQLC